MKVGSGEWAVGSGESRLSWNRCEHNSWSLLQKILQTPPRVLPASSGRELIFLASPQGIGGTQGGLALACARGLVKVLASMFEMLATPRYDIKSAKTSCTV